MIINNNNIANRQFVPYANNLTSLAKSAQRLSTGLNFANASDGTGDLGVAHKMRMNHRGTTQLLSGMQNAASLAQTQDDLLGQVEDIITRMTELAASSVDPTKSSTDRDVLENEFRQLGTEIAEVAANSQYNGDAIFGNARTVRLGYETAEVMNLSAIALATMDFASISVSTQTLASAAIISLASRSGSLSLMRTKARGFGARLERTKAFANDYIANVANAESAIKDVDIAAESGRFTAEQVKLAASQAVLAQSNGITQGALQFLQF